MDANDPSRRGSPVKRSHVETNLIRRIAGKTTHILALDKWRVLAWLESPRMPLQTRGTMTCTLVHTLAHFTWWALAVRWMKLLYLEVVLWGFIGAVLWLTFGAPWLQCGHRRRKLEMQKNILGSSIRKNRWFTPKSAHPLMCISLIETTLSHKCWRSTKKCFVCCASHTFGTRRQCCRCRCWSDISVRAAAFGRHLWMTINIPDSLHTRLTKINLLPPHRLLTAGE